MSTAELRGHLFSLIDGLPASKLTEAYDMLKERFGFTEEPQAADGWDSLPEWQQKGLQEAIDELDRGEGIPHAEVMKEMRQQLQNLHERKTNG